MIWFLAILIAWLVGGIPFGVIIGRARGVDIRQHGSRNIGATNVGRVLGRPWGILCFVLDAAKGAGPVLAAGAWLGPLGADPLTLAPADAWGWLGVATAAVAGHMASPWLKLQGGKGVATAAGALAAIWPLMTIPILAAAVTWGLTLAVSRYVSLASIAAAGSLPVWLAVSLGIRLATRDETEAAVAVAWTSLIAPALLVILVAGLVVFRHRSNITRLRAGTESRIGAARAT
jgi:glycerol-3-phosphate acyltransferase PlsY